jgi:hypothetical protein
MIDDFLQSYYYSGLLWLMASSLNYWAFLPFLSPVNEKKGAPFSGTPQFILLL